MVNGLHKKQQRIENTNYKHLLCTKTLHIVPHLEDATPTVGREEYYGEGEAQRGVTNLPNDTRANQWQRQSPDVAPFPTKPHRLLIC